MQSVRWENELKKDKDPKWRGDASSTSSLHTDSSQRDVVEDDKWLILGMSRGQLIFIDVFDLDILHSRYDVANSEVIMIREV